MRGLPGVVGATQADSGPAYTDSSNASDMKQPGYPPASITWTKVGPGYFDVYGARLLAGRLPSAQFGGDESAHTPGTKGRRQVVLNC